jgi:glycosyltransferase involved in cell wall biosynthesis
MTPNPPTTNQRKCYILAFSSLFPNSMQPTQGVFLEHRLAHLAESDRADLTVVAPVPYFPIGSDAIFGRYSKYAKVPKSEVRRGLAVIHPRYPVIPKVGMNLAPWLMAISMIDELRRLREAGFDFDIIDSYYLYPDGVAATDLGILFDRPVLLTAFGSDVSLLPKYILPRAAIQWATRRSGCVTAVCEALKDRLLELNVPAENVHVIRHGVDLELFVPPDDRARVRGELQLSGPTIISVGGLVPRKGHDIAIRTISLLPGHGLVIIGDGPEMPRLVRLASDLQVSDRIRFLGDLPQADVAVWMGAADLLINCSDREGIANVLLEAMACGTPVVATNIWGTPEAVSCQEAGILVSERSPTAMADAVRRLFAARPDRAATRRHAEAFSWQETASRHMDLALKLASSRTAGKH